MQKWRQSETADCEEWQRALEREAVIRPLASKSRLSVCRAAVKSPDWRFFVFNNCPGFNYIVTAFESRTFVLKSRTKFVLKFVRDLNAKVAPYELVSIMRGPSQAEQTTVAD
jgi:hypothetical protein